MGVERRWYWWARLEPELGRLGRTKDVIGGLVLGLQDIIGGLGIVHLAGIGTCEWCDSTVIVVSEEMTVFRQFLVFRDEII